MKIKYSPLCFLIALLIHVSVWAQTDSLILKSWKKNKPLAILTAGSTLTFTMLTTGYKQSVETSYRKTTIKSISDSTIVVAYKWKDVHLYDSTLYLKTDSTCRHDSDVVDTISLNNITSFTIYENDWTSFLIIPVALGAVGYFVAPFATKTTGAGNLNTAVYYPLVAYGLASALAFNYLIMQSYFGPLPYTVCTEKPTKKKHIACTSIKNKPYEPFDFFTAADPVCKEPSLCTTTCTIP